MTQDEWLKVGSKWKTTSGKKYVLFPALDSIMKNISRKKILDVGCGDGVFVRRCTEKSAHAVGIDISPDTIAECKKADPSGEYYVMDTKKISLKQKFDYVMSLFVLLSFDKKNIVKAIRSMSKNLNEKGRLIIAVPHPAFEEDDNSDTMNKTFAEEYSYSKKGLPIQYTHKTKKNISFIDFHWMIEDYVECIKEGGLVIENLLEPLPIADSKKENPKIYEARVKYPPIIIFVCKSSK